MFWVGLVFMVMRLVYLLDFIVLMLLVVPSHRVGVMVVVCSVFSGVRLNLVMCLSLCMVVVVLFVFWNGGMLLFSSILILVVSVSW